MVNSDDPAKDAWRRRLRHAIVTRDLKITQVSQDLGRHRDWLSHVVTGRANPSIENLMAACDHIGIDIADLFIDDGADDVSAAALKRLFSGLTPSQTLLAVEMIRALQNT